MMESSLFDDKTLSDTSWITNTEMYEAIMEIILQSHITGIQRIKGMWRIYIDNINDKVTLLSTGIELRGRHIGLLNTNPKRFDTENTLSIRIKDILLS